MFWRSSSTSDDSRGTSTQTIVNQMEREEETESCNSDGNSMNSNWSELLPTSRKVEYKQCSDNVKPSTSTVGTTTMQSCAPPVKRTMKNIVLVPYKPKPTDWGSWHVKSPYATSTIASPKENMGEQEKSTEEIVYEPHSPYYSPVHPPEFYEDE